MNYIVIDTETCPLDETFEEVIPQNMFAYDIGWLVCNDNGEVLTTSSFVNADIFLNEKALMKNAYYAEKIPQYWEDIKRGSRTLTNLYNIRCSLLKDIKKYEITHIFAHNCRFDYGTLNTTERWVSKSKYRYFFPYGITICDTLKMARKVFKSDNEYKQFCIDNEYLTKNNQIQLKAETVYKYLTDNNEFSEKHTGLEDCLIEKEILMYCLKFLNINEGRLFK